MIPAQDKRLIIVTGMSGGGKSIVLNALEDLGFYCIDNLPVNLVKEFVKQVREDGGQNYTKVAVGIDARNPAEDLSHFPEVMADLKESGFGFELVYIEADDNILIKRYSETRRRHPLSNDQLSLGDAIVHERMLLEPLLDNASLRIDTSHTNIHQLRDFVRERVARRLSGTLSIHVMSFGFKYGTPPEADFQFDVRCLPNPYWDTSLRDYTGRDEPVIEFLERHPEVKSACEELEQFLDLWVPRYENHDRSYLTIAIGCTGGHHRSVYMVEKIAQHLITQDKDVLASHRDMAL